jgi:hypothetical protein
MARIRIDDLPVADNLTPEQEALIQGAGLRSFRPRLEFLEGRDMPAMLAPGLHLTDGVLTMQGTDNADQAQVSIVGKANNPDIPQVQVEYNGYQGTFEVDQIRQIKVLQWDANKDSFVNLTKDFEGGRLAIQDTVNEPTITLNGGVLTIQGNAALNRGEVKIVEGDNGLRQVQVEVNGLKKTFAVGQVERITFLWRTNADQFVNHTTTDFGGQYRIPIQMVGD